MEIHVGTVLKDNGNFGFIKPDAPGCADMFVMPVSCEPFGKVIPPVGTRVQYIVVDDPKTGRPRAESVQPANDIGTDELTALAHHAFAADFFQAQAQAQAQAQGAVEVDLQSTAQSLVQQLLVGLPGLAQIDVRSAAGLTDPAGSSSGRHTGTVKVNSGKYGFIKQDSGEMDMFCLPPVPSVGSRVTYDIINDPKTRQLRADNVQLGEGAADGSAELAALGQTSIQGVMEQLLVGGLFSAITGQDAAQPAAIVQPTAIAPVASLSAATVPGGAMGNSSGTMGSDRGNFGFIAQDSGEPDMFTLPPFFPTGTRVIFDIVQDPKTGRPRAVNVTDLNGNRPTGAPYGAVKATVGPIDARSSPYGNAALNFGKDGRPQSKVSDQLVTGTVTKVSDKFGFISQDSCEADMFVIPLSCEAFGRILPPEGTRVMYSVVLDPKTHKPRAENVRPAPEISAI